MDLQTIWFILVGVLLVGYAILDGFDLGVGMLQVFSGTEEEKKALLTSIAPFWDGNEVWLLTGGGALFAAFPHAYSTVFSGFYLALMLLLVGLIFRALSIEFRNQVASDTWKKTWDLIFSITSFLVTVLLGVALGNIFVGIPLDDTMNYTGSFFTLLRPLPLLVGITGVCMIILQGATYLTMKTDGDLAEKIKSKAFWSWRAFIVMLILTTAFSAVTEIEKMELFISRWTAYPTLILLVGAIYLVKRFLQSNDYFKAFISSSAIILSMFLIVAVSIFPNIVPSLAPATDMSIYKAASSHLTLTIMLIIALIGMPLVIGYTTYIHIVFRGKIN